MELVKNDLKLRDLKESDIDDEIYWMNEETCWMSADTPWVTIEKVDGEQLRRDMKEYFLNIPSEVARWRLEIEKGGKHIGFVSSYFLNNDYTVVDWEKVDSKASVKKNNLIRALGIEICEEDYWGQGIGGEALELFMKYYKNFDEDEFVLETWSGNYRMIKCAKKLGFKEVKRDKQVFEFDGLKYDGIVMKIKFN